MRAGIVAGCIGLALLVSGCDTTDSRYFSYGVGTNLYSEDIAQATQFQDIYLTQLCRQALPVLSSSNAECLNAVPNAAGWELIVQAGLNDVDRRCDAYLAWLDDRRRTNNAILKEIGDITVASMAMMRVTGVGANPITLAGLAFGLASNTFTNINSRLILEVDRTTVNTLVIRRRGEFRIDLKKASIADRPAAIYVMRQYLTICTPFAIETDINATITVFQQVGRGGLDNKGPLLSPDAVPFRASADTSKPPPRPPGDPSVPEFKDIIVNYNPKVHTTRFVSGIVRKLCLVDADAKNVSKTTSAIQVFQMTLRDVRRVANEQITGRLSDADILVLDDESSCKPAVFANFYEKALPGGIGIKSPDVIPLLNRALASDKRLAATAPDSDVRARIVEIRQALGSKLTLRGANVSNQLTPDLVIELNKLPSV